MPQEADFYGDRLRLSAFLRVVGNGIPKRPIRFRRRVLVTDNSLEPSTHLETTQEASTGAKTVSGEPFTKYLMSILPVHGYENSRTQCQTVSSQRLRLAVKVVLDSNLTKMFLD
jgi:hypothetical protein